MSRSRRPNKKRLLRLDPPSEVLCDCWHCIKSGAKHRIIVTKRRRREKHRRFEDC